MKRDVVTVFLLEGRMTGGIPILLVNADSPDDAAWPALWSTEDVV